MEIWSWIKFRAAINTDPLNREQKNRYPNYLKAPDNFKRSDLLDLFGAQISCHKYS